MSLMLKSAMGKIMQKLLMESGVINQKDLRIIELIENEIVEDPNIVAADSQPLPDETFGTKPGKDHDHLIATGKLGQAISDNVRKMLEKKG